MLKSPRSSPPAPRICPVAIDPPASVRAINPGETRPLILSGIANAVAVGHNGGPIHDAGTARATAGCGTGEVPPRCAHSPIAPLGLAPPNPPGRPVPPAPGSDWGRLNCANGIIPGLTKQRRDFDPDPRSSGHGSKPSTPTPAALPVCPVSIDLPTNPLAVNLGGESRSLTLSGIANVVAAGGGGVLIRGGDGLTCLSLGDGNDCTLLGGALNTIVLGNGNDTVDAGTAQATVCFGTRGVQLSYDDSLVATLGLAVPDPLGQPVSPAQWSNWGWFDCGTGNIGLFDGWNDSPGSGDDNTGTFDGDGNAAGHDGNGNIGVLNGDLNGNRNTARSSGTGDGNGNIGALNGVFDGNLNIGADDGTGDGDGNTGVLNGSLDGNLNTGVNDGNDNGNANLGDDNGSRNGNGTPPATQVAGATDGITLTGGLDTVVVGNGNDVIRATAGLSTVRAGNGADEITLGGSYDVVSAGNGGDCVRGTVNHAAVQLGNGGNQVMLSGSGCNVIETGAGDDVIRLSGTDNWVDAGAAPSMNIIYGGAGDDTFVTTLPGQGYDRIYNFTLDNGDQLELSKALCAAGWNGRIADLGCSLQATTDAGNTWITVAGACAGAPVAELMGVQASLQQLLAHHSLVLQG